MLYDFKKDFDIEMYKKRSKELIDKKAIIELKEKRSKRTLSQNSYLHVCISLFSIETGYTLDEMKTHLKRKCTFMRYKKETIDRLKKKGITEDQEIFLKKSSHLDTKGLTDWIDWIRNYAGQKGVDIPSPDDYRRNWAEYEKKIQACKAYL